MELEQLIGIAGAPVAVALTQVCKPFVTDKRFWPIVAIAWSVLFNLALAYVLRLDYGTSAILGVLAGLAAGGLYSDVKAVRERPLPHG